MILRKRPGMGGLFLLLLALQGAAGGEESREPIMKRILDSWKSLRNRFSSCTWVFLNSKSIFLKLESSSLRLFHESVPPKSFNLHIFSSTNPTFQHAYFFLSIPSRSLNLHIFLFLKTNWSPSRSFNLHIFSWI